MYKSILNESSLNSGLIITDDFTFDLDINTVEQHTSKLRLTENPIENGANIADHAVLEPKEVTVNGLVVSYNPNNNIDKSVTSYDIKDYPSPIPVRSITPQAEKMVKGYYTSLNQTKEENLVQPVADFLPDYQSPKFQKLSSDRIADAHEKLLAIQRSGKPVTLLTNARQYKNMIITSIGLTQKESTVGEFIITFREIFIVETQIFNVLRISIPEVTNLGQTQLQEQYNLSSVVRNIVVGDSSSNSISYPNQGPYDNNKIYGYPSYGYPGYGYPGYGYPGNKNIGNQNKLNQNKLNQNKLNQNKRYQNKRYQNILNQNKLFKGN